MEKNKPDKTGFSIQRGGPGRGTGREGHSKEEIHSNNMQKKEKEDGENR